MDQYYNMENPRINLPFGDGWNSTHNIGDFGDGLWNVGLPQ